MKKITNSIIIVIFICMFINLCVYEIHAVEVIDSSIDAVQIAKKEDKQEDVKDTTVDSVFEGAQDFLSAGDETTLDEDKLHEVSNFIFNLLLAFAMIAAVIVGIILGIQFMTSSIEEKAKVKESLVPYVVSCIVIFGAFGIWKLAVTILSQW